MNRLDVGKHLVVDPRICHGKLTFKGTRVPVGTVLHCLAKGKSMEAILADWPELTWAAVEEAVELAAAALVERSTAGAGGER
jgi:uncharacterized protein (DUF433 family)